jgi:TMEM175 potassium channel family protein
MLLCSLSFALLLFALLGANEADAPISKAAGRGRKGQITILAYVLAIAVAFLWPLVAVAIYVAVALMWLVPDKRFEQLVE